MGLRCGEWSGGVCARRWAWLACRTMGLSLGKRCNRPAKARGLDLVACGYIGKTGGTKTGIKQMVQYGYRPYHKNTPLFRVEGQVYQTYTVCCNHDPWRKKATGCRWTWGREDINRDIREAIDSVVRWQEMQTEGVNHAPGCFSPALDAAIDAEPVKSWTTPGLSG